MQMKNTETTGTADTVQVGVGGLRNVVVDDDVHTFDINTYHTKEHDHSHKQKHGNAMLHVLI